MRAEILVLTEIDWTLYLAFFFFYTGWTAYGCITQINGVGSGWVFEEK
jgi:hypothetical protein